MPDTSSVEKCQICGDAVLVHIHLARDRKWVETQHLCEKHYNDAIDDVFERDPPSPHEDSPLQAATRFDVEMLFIQMQKWDGLYYLREVDGTRRFWSKMGYCEAAALYWQLQPHHSPGTYQVFVESLRALGGKLQDIVIDQSDDNPTGFHAFLRIEREGEIHAVKSRPSDAINLAVASNAPIWVSKEAYAKRLQNKTL